ncbi:MAG: hypothetical protein KDH93_25970, partial [Rhodoferax sp.]|nr:hypothetical protein [Rhodoferax sp.]
LVADVLETVRAASEDGFLSPRVLPTRPAVAGLVAQLQQASADALAHMSLRDLVRQGDDAPVEPLPPEPVWVEPSPET